MNGAWPEGIDRIVLDDTDSTMAEAARRAPPARPTWILAHNQTAARGRRGRPWAMPPGNFAASYLTAPDRPAAEVALTSFQAAIALYDTLGLYVARERLSLKWPNDVLLDGGKVAGILLESSGRGTAVDWLAVGIGINLASAPAPDAVEPRATRPISLTEAGADPVAPEDILEHLATSMEIWGRIWRTDGFGALRTLWLHRAARLGEPITARLPREEITGLFETIDDQGCLILKTTEGRRAIAAAEVFFD